MTVRLPGTYSHVSEAQSSKFTSWQNPKTASLTAREVQIRTSFSRDDGASTS